MGNLMGNIEIISRRQSTTQRLTKILDDIALIPCVDDVRKNPHHGQIGHKGYKRFKLKFVVERFRSVHGHKYCYRKVEYRGQSRPVRVMCPEHGEFFIKPVRHWKGKGCDQCRHK
jgi:hypothetical protein